MRKRCWGQQLWARGYWTTTRGNVTDEMWVEYIQNQTPPEPDDNFNVTRLPAEGRADPVSGRTEATDLQAVENSLNPTVKDFTRLHYPNAGLIYESRSR
ncbi:hypothetical protein MesoLjLc_59040 [Mesorhizobium sp. L-8-10]|nr:hypothetical protein MesoLjLc_59040 [Mesorhizobium sp. L-8-10]